MTDLNISMSEPRNLKLLLVLKALVKEDGCDGSDRGHHVKNKRTMLYRASIEEAAPLA